MSFSVSVSGVLGPLLAGILVATIGTGWAIIADAATFAIGIWLLSSLDRLSFVRRSQDRVLSDIAAGWTSVRSCRWIVAVILLGAVFQLTVVAHPRGLRRGH